MEGDATLYGELRELSSSCQLDGSQRNAGQFSRSAVCKYALKFILDFCDDPFLAWIYAEYSS